MLGEIVIKINVYLKRLERIPTLEQFFGFYRAKSVSVRQFLAVFTLLLVISLSPNFNLLNQEVSSISIDTVAAVYEEGVGSYKFNDNNSLLPGNYKPLPDKEELSKVKEYVVEPGDNISFIASKFNLKTGTVLGANGIGQGEIIKPGKVLKILPRDGMLYTVKKGDSLSAIAKKYEISEKIIKRVNNKTDDYILAIDDELILPGVDYAIPKYSRSNYAVATNYYVPVKTTFNNSSGARLTLPLVGGVVTQRYNYGHQAIDIAGARNSNIFAAEGGKVIEVSVGSYNNGYGNKIIIDHGNGLQTLYAHLSTVHVQVGDRVGRGQLIAQQGNTGRSTGPHLHFEVRNKGSKENPANWLW